MIFLPPKPGKKCRFDGGCERDATRAYQLQHANGQRLVVNLCDEHGDVFAENIATIETSRRHNSEGPS